MKCVVALAILAFALLGQAAEEPTAKVLSNVERAIAGMDDNWQLRENAAEAAAKRFLAGGNLWVSGSIPRFDIEWVNRAGGLMPVAAVKDPAKIASGDVLLYGCFDGMDSDDAGVLKPVHDKGVMVIAFGSDSLCPKTRQVVDFFLPNYLPRGTPMQRQVAASMNLTHLWALTGDFVGACTRAGKMPTMWQSVMVDGARARNARYRTQSFHDDMRIPAQEPGKTGAAYLERIRSGVRGLRTQLDVIGKASAALRKTVAAGHTVFHANLGHFEPIRLVPVDLHVKMQILKRGKKAENLGKQAERGDALLCVWYTALPTELLQAAREKGVTSVCMVASNPENPIDTHAADIFIDPQWRFGDAAVTFPGYDVRILPPSGVLNSLVFYTILADCR